MKKLQVGDRELRQITELIGQTFDEILGTKKRSILNNIFKERKQSTKRAFYDRIVELYNLGGFSNNQYRELIAEKFGVPALGNKTVQNIIGLTTELQGIKDEGLKNLIERDILKNRIASEITSLAPSGIARKISTIQAIQQLLNPKTIIRNVVGNELAYRAERAQMYLGTFLDISKSTLTGKKRQITFKTGRKFFEPTKGFAIDTIRAAKAAWKGYNLYGYNAEREGKYLTTSSSTFKNDWNPFKYLEKVLNVSLRGLDYAAYMRGLKDRAGEIAYITGINRGLKGAELNKFATDYIETMGEEAFKQAQEYGEYITFQDKDNYIGETFSKGKAVLNRLGIGETVNRGGISTKEFGLGDIVLKYARTPGILLARAFEFSPAGFVKGIYHVTQGISANKKGESYDGRKSTEAFSRAIFGTAGFTMLGYALSALGMITGEDDEDQEINEVAKAIGLGRYN